MTLTSVQILVSVVTGLTVLSAGAVVLEAYRISRAPDDDARPGQPPEPEPPPPEPPAPPPEAAESTSVIRGTTPTLQIPDEPDGPESMALKKPTVVRGVPLKNLRSKPKGGQTP